MLTPEMSGLAQVVIDKCKSKGVDLLIYCNLRPLEEQAICYRQSRSTKEIQAKMSELIDMGFDYLADIIEKVGPQSGPHVTNAAPGESWHNYGEAFDAVPLIGGKPAWNYKGSELEWTLYGQSCREIGLNWAGDWKRFKELPHAQLKSGSNPLKEYAPEQIYKILKNNKLI
jgi:peptidoglycan L-alanyl-D-glutamate endopeptidase CwlK